MGSGYLYVYIYLLWKLAKKDIENRDGQFFFWVSRFFSKWTRFQWYLGGKGVGLINNIQLSYIICNIYVQTCVSIYVFLSIGTRW